MYIYIYIIYYIYVYIYVYIYNLLYIYIYIYIYLLRFVSAASAEPCVTALCTWNEQQTVCFCLFGIQYTLLWNINTHGMMLND